MPRLQHGLKGEKQIRAVARRNHAKTRRGVVCPDEYGCEPIRWVPAVVALAQTDAVLRYGFGLECINPRLNAPHPKLVVVAAGVVQLVARALANRRAPVTVGGLEGDELVYKSINISLEQLCLRYAVCARAGVTGPCRQCAIPRMAGMDLTGGVGVPPPPPCCDEASRYAPQKNPVTD